MKLYYAPGTCAWAVHVALIWSGEPYELEEVDFGRFRDEPGVVPAEEEQGIRA
ncbi:MAG: hypothetical protein OXI46_03930 [Gemmatimonadota bacterium]|nr:hypothetical protein [Gemmatimonadota bacterium]